MGSWQSGGTYTVGEKLIFDDEAYVCNTAGVQTVTFSSNAALWDIVTSRDSSQLEIAATGVYATAVAGTAYISPEQHGGIYGTIYRQYFGVKTTTQTIATVDIDVILDCAVWDATAKLVYRGTHDDGTDTMKLAVGTDTVVFTIVNLVCTKGWVDYTVDAS
jgi:hypothetical protein